MMGKRVMAEPLFYTFRLEDHVPVDHPLRGHWQVGAHWPERGSWAMLT